MIMIYLIAKPHILYFLSDDPGAFNSAVEPKGIREHHVESRQTAFEPLLTIRTRNRRMIIRGNCILERIRIEVAVLHAGDEEEQDDDRRDDGADKHEIPHESSSDENDPRRADVDEQREYHEEADVSLEYVSHVVSPEKGPESRG